jgi:hypothetical protein
MKLWAIHSPPGMPSPGSFHLPNSSMYLLIWVYLVCKMANYLLIKKIFQSFR